MKNNLNNIEWKYFIGGQGRIRKLFRYKDIINIKSKVLLYVKLEDRCNYNDINSDYSYSNLQCYLFSRNIFIDYLHNYVRFSDKKINKLEMFQFLTKNLAI